MYLLLDQGQELLASFDDLLACKDAARSMWPTCQFDGDPGYGGKVLFIYDGTDNILGYITKEKL